MRLLFHLVLLLFAAVPAAATTFSLETVESRDNVGEYLWLVLDDLGRPQMSYYNRTTGQLRYAIRKLRMAIDEPPETK